MNYKKELEIAKEIAKQAGDIMRQYFDNDQQVEIKSDNSPVTIADKKINSLVIKELAKSFPEDGVIGEEESTASYGMGRRWICDPIDGTKGFTWSVPTAMFSLALVVDGSPVVGVCYEPMLDKMYWAVKNSGAFKNGSKIKVNADSLESGTVSVTNKIQSIRNGAPFLDELINRKVKMATFSSSVSRIVRVADGKFVAYVGEHISPHDIAAVDLVVKEAGGKTTNMIGEELDYSKPFKGAILSNGLVHDELVGMIERSQDG